MNDISHEHINLTTKAQKLLKLIASEGVESPADLAEKAMHGECPAICMVEGCDHVEPMEPDQQEGMCSQCDSNTMVSALVLLELI